MVTLKGGISNTPSGAGTTLLKGSVSYAEPFMSQAASQAMPGGVSFFNNGLKQVRAGGIEYAREYSWDVYFLGAPKPFNTWFPANSVREDIAQIQYYTVNIGHHAGLSIPISIGQNTCSVTFYDTDEAVLETWISRWINGDMFGNYTKVAGGVGLGQGMEYMIKCAKVLYLGRTNSRRSLVKYKAMSVLPEGGISFGGSSSDQARQFTVNFRILGYLSHG